MAIGPADVHVDSALTDFSVAYLQNPAASIARRAFPVINVPKQSDYYFVYDAATNMQTEMQKRAPGTPAAERHFKLSKAAYFCDVLSLATNISRQVRENADPAIDPEEDALKVLLQDAMIKEERDWATVAFASSWGTNTSPGTVWSNAAAYPLSDITTGIRTVLLATGMKPNVLACGADVWYTGLSLHEDILARMPETSARIVTKEFVAQLLGLDEILVSEVVYNSAQEGLSASNAFAATRTSSLLFYRNPNPGRMSATAGATFAWTGLGGAGAEVSRYDVEKDDAFPRIELNLARSFQIVGSDLGYYLTSCVS